MQKIDLLKTRQMPDDEAELRKLIFSQFPAWVGSKPGEFKRGTHSSALHIQLPCEGCNTLVTKTLWEVRTALKQNYSAARCEDARCQVQTFRLQQMPSDMREFWLNVQTHFPKWAGKEPETFVKGSRHASLMVEVPCRCCHLPVRQMLSMFAKGLRADSRPPSCGKKSCKEELVKLDRMPTSEQELYQTVVDKAPRWVGSAPGSFRRGNPSAYLNVEVPCENCQQPVTSTLTEIVAAIQHGRLRVICERDCRDQRLILDQIPANDIELYQRLVEIHPRWVGDTPGSFRRSDSAAALRIEYPCESCQQPVVLTLGSLLKGLRKGFRTPTCGQENCQIQILNLGGMPQDELALWRVVRAEFPRWVGSSPGKFKRGNTWGSLKISIPCEACSEPVEKMLTSVRGSLKSGYLTVVCNKTCLGLTQRREARPCKGCGALISLHPSYNYCGLECPGRKPELLTFSHQPADADQLISWISKQAPGYLNTTGDGLDAYGWGQGLVLQMPCPTCDNIFERDAKLALYSFTTYNSDSLYCGRECFDLRRKVTPLCRGCNNPLPDALRHKVWYCSRACRSFVWPKEKPCIHCQAPFMAVSHKAFTCSPKCAAASKRRYYPHKPYGPKYLKMRQLVLERDSCCMNCSIDENLHCHHINHVGTDHCANNLIILCDGCHGRHHRKQKLVGLSELAQSKTAAMPGEWHEQIAMVELEFLEKRGEKVGKQNHQFEFWS